MKSRCRTCAHPQRAEIDSAILTGEKLTRAFASRYGLPRQTIQEHHRRGHCKVPEDVKRQTAVERAHWLVDALQDLLKLAINNDRGDVSNLSREYRQMLAQARIWDREDAAEAAARDAALAARPLDQPGVAGMLDRLLSSLGEQAKGEVIEWLQRERDATDPD